MLNEVGEVAGPGPAAMVVHVIATSTKQATTHPLPPLYLFPRLSPSPTVILDVHAYIGYAGDT